MKLTLELPDEIGRKFKATVPSSRRSRLVAELLAERLNVADKALARAAKKANTFKSVNEDMRDWEALNEVD